MTDDIMSESFQDPSLGAVLAHARAARGMSVEDVAAATRIRSQLIGEIERDEFDHCGGAVYARGHIRAIAHAVGADAEELVAEFDHRYGGLPVTPIDPTTLPKLTASTDRDIVRSRRTSPRWATATVAVLAVGAVLLAVTWLVGRAGGTEEAGDLPAPVPPGSPSETAASPTPTATGTTAAPTSTPTTPPPTTSSPTPSGVTVLVRVSGGPSWIRVTSSADREIFARVLESGQTKQWHDERLLTLKFGNAQAVDVVVNGRDLGAPCDRTVCTVQFPTSAAAG